MTRLTQLALRATVIVPAALLIVLIETAPRVHYG